MKYKVGDKVLIKATITEDEYGLKYPFDVTVGNHSRFSVSEDDIASKTYEDGLNDAWKLAKKIYYHNEMSRDLLLDVFGACNINTLFKRTPQELVEKLKAYEKSQQIQVGDVVRFKNSKTELLITTVARGLNGIHIQTDECGKVGEVNSGICREHVEKTGKHLDIEHLLEQIRGNE